jgi:hypothetical protein
VRPIEEVATMSAGLVPDCEPLHRVGRRAPGTAGCAATSRNGVRVGVCPIPTVVRPINFVPTR